MKWLAEDSLWFQLVDSILEECGLTGCSMCLDQKSLHAVLSPVARIQAVEVRVASLTIIPNNSFVDFLLSVLATLNC